MIDKSQGRAFLYMYGTVLYAHICKNQITKSADES